MIERLSSRPGFCDLVAAEQESECDQQTASGDERDHVAHAGEQDPPDARTPPDAAAGVAAAAARPSLVALGSFAAATASWIISFGFLIARLTPDRTTGLPENRC